MSVLATLSDLPATGEARLRTRGAQRRCCGLTGTTDHVTLHGCHLLGRETLGVAAHEVRTTDLAAQRDPRTRQRVLDIVERQLSELAAAGVTRSSRPRVGPEGRAAMATLHPVLAQWWGDQDATEPDGFTFRHAPRWRDLVPSAAALWALEHPGDPELPGMPALDLSPDDWAVLTHTWDAVGIRSRAAVVSAILRDRFAGAGATAWLSLGSGGLSALMAAARDLGACGSPAMLEVRDGDEQALALAEELSDRGRVPVLTQRQDLFDLGALASAAGGYDLVDLVGFLEYLPAEPLHTRRARVPSATELVRAAVAATRPGGIVILGNMRTDRPHLEFVERIIQWPHIVPRSLEELIAVIEGAGMPRDAITLHLPDDGVYAVATIEVANGSVTSTSSP
ncbi:hypothetical protein [Demequina sp. NBRC 110056]|uniref:hypothetical protein n=1 Tax=Demequina sp. NBRC 110056 TaxID=1570345 RepID=UPI0009FC2372|nr:hypothetical protein [Demequina sp. NBRC 110056]